MTMDAYISTMSTMADIITASGIEIQETDLITTILSKLPEDYKTVKRIIYPKTLLLYNSLLLNCFLKKVDWTRSLKKNENKRPWWLLLPPETPTFSVPDEIGIVSRNTARSMENVFMILRAAELWRNKKLPQMSKLKIWKKRNISWWCPQAIRVTTNSHSLLIVEQLLAWVSTSHYSHTCRKQNVKSSYLTVKELCPKR
jgi:hypothetical protein